MIRSEAPFDPPARPLVEIVSLRLQGSLCRPELRAAAQARRLFAATMKWLLFTLNAFWLTVSDSFILLGFSLCEGVVPSLTIERSQLLQRVMLFAPEVGGGAIGWRPARIHRSVAADGFASCGSRGAAADTGNDAARAGFALGFGSGSAAAPAAQARSRRTAPRTASAAAAPPAAD